MPMGERLKEQASGLILPALFVVAWVLALTGSLPPGGSESETLSESAIRWILYMIAWAFLSSAVMHSVFAKRTAAMIGWQTNGFQYEIGFASLGLGVAGILAGATVPAAWLPVAAAGAIFLVLAGANHIREMVKDKNLSAGNTTILLYDFGLPISYAIALISIGAA